jgi:hypothetical protein
VENYAQLAYKLRKALSPYLLPFTAENIGTYTPTYLGGTTPGATTYSAQQGAWWRYGPIVLVTGTVTWSAATGTGTARISLPFTAASTANQNLGGACVVSGVTFANSAPELFIVPATAYFTLVSPLTNAAAAAVAIEAAGTIVFSAFYALE